MSGRKGVDRRQGDWRKRARIEPVSIQTVEMKGSGSASRKFWPISPYFTPFHFDENCNLIRVFKEFSCALVFHHIPP